MKGVVIGKFAPLHNRHEWVIKKALEQCDELFILVLEDKKFTNSCPTILRNPFHISNRIKAAELLASELRRTAKKPVKTGFVDISDLSGIPVVTPEFIKLCLGKMEEQYFVPNAIFASTDEYRKDYKKHLPKCKYVVLKPDKNIYPKSETELRSIAMDIQMFKGMIKNYEAKLESAMPWYSWYLSLYASL